MHFHCIDNPGGHTFLDHEDEILMDLDNNKSTLITFKIDFEGGSGFLKSKVKFGEYALNEVW
jgi:hypothetical protein